MANMLNLLDKWCSRKDFDDVSEEAIEDNLRIQEEQVFISGKWNSVRRIFVSARGAKSYERVGWLVNADVLQCMICSKGFVAGVLEKHHCAGCGNIVCHNCSPEVGTIFELSSGGPLRVCIQCYWGQDPIYAILHEDVVLAPFIVKRNNSYKQLAPSSPPKFIPSLHAAANTNSSDLPRDQVSVDNSRDSSRSSEVPSASKGYKVSPTPKLVLKTRQANNDRKIFINICGHNDIPENRYITAELAKEGVENSGQQCLIFDVSCNLNVLNKAMEDVTSDALHQICFQAMKTIRKVFRQVLKDEYTLPRIRGNYKGDSVQQIYISAEVLEESERARLSALSLLPAMLNNVSDPSSASTPPPMSPKGRLDDLKSDQDALDEHIVEVMEAQNNEDVNDQQDRQSLAELADISSEQDKLQEEILMLRRAEAAAEDKRKARQAAAVAERERLEAEAVRDAAEAFRQQEQLNEEERERVARQEALKAEEENIAREQEEKRQLELMELEAESQRKQAQEVEAERRLAEEEASRKAEETKLAAALSLPKSKLVRPQPVGVIKTREQAEAARKVFINVCVDPDVSIGHYGIGDAIKQFVEEKDGSVFLVVDVCCNKSFYEAKLDDDQGDILELYVDMLEKISKKFNHPIQIFDLKYPKTRNNYKTGPNGGAVVDEMNIPINRESSVSKSSNGRSSTNAEQPAEGPQGPRARQDSLTPNVPPQKGGWLTKEGHMISSWKKRYFLLKEGIFGYYGDESLSKQHGTVDLINATVAIVDVKGVKRLVVTTAKGVLYKLEGGDVETLREWMEALERHIAYVSVMALINERGSSASERRPSITEKSKSFLSRLSFKKSDVADNLDP